jgi:GT2 family glycosyltransferase
MTSIWNACGVSRHDSDQGGPTLLWTDRAMMPVGTGRNGTAAVVIVNYNSAELVIAGLPSLVSELASLEDGVAVIVDNASPNGDGAKLEAFLAGFDGRDRIHLIRSAVNGGFAAGNNLAFRWLRAAGRLPEGVMLLNPDATLQPGALANLLAMLRQHPKAGLVGASIVDADNRPAGAAFHFPTIGMELARDIEIGPVYRLWPITVDVGASPLRVDWVSGAAFMIRREVLEQVGELDEGYFLYFEEIDYAHRVQEAGWEVWHTPDALVTHDAGSTTGIVGGRPKHGRMPHYWFVAWLRYFTKNYGLVYARLAALARLMSMFIGSIIRALRGRPAKYAPSFILDFTRFCLFAGANAHRIYEKDGS